jgi:hypothetical protein
MPLLLGYKSATVLGLEAGRIIKVGDRWGVICSSGAKDGAYSPVQKKDHTLVDFWDGGLEYVHKRTVVEVLPGHRTYPIYV